MKTTSHSAFTQRLFDSISPLILLPLTALYLITGQHALASDEYEFDPTFLQGGADAAELAKFSRGNLVLPGTYLTDIIVNDISIGRDDVEFRKKPGQDSAEPCLSVELLDRAGVDLLKLPNVNIKDRQSCVDLTAAVEASSVHYDSGEQKLLISVPQANLRHSVQGYVDPSQWDQGVTAGILNYNYGSFYSSTQQDGAQSYLGLDGGINLGAWRFRSQSSLNWNNATRDWQSRALYAQRDIRSLSSQLTLGDSSTSGNLFDSFSLRGVQMASDERMLPDALSGYAPVVRGQANTNAKVTITQNGYTVYETTVAPGPFEINDLNPSGYGGDLEVVVTEANGQVHKFSVPYASVVRMLRPGAQRYSAVLGQYRDGSDDSNAPIVGQLTYERGLNNMFTGYTGVLAADGYFSPMIGTAMNTPIGAFGLDVTHASTRLPSDVNGTGNASGQSVRLSYSKTLPQTGSSVSVAAYRYSTSGFYNLQDAMLAMKDDDLGYWPDVDALNGGVHNRFNSRTAQLQRQRSTMQVTLNQSLGSAGSLYVTGSASNYWNQTGTSTQYQIGYSGSTHYFSYSVAAMRSMYQSGGNSDEIVATFSIPLGGRTHASSSVSFNDNGASVRGALDGSAGQNGEYAWGVSGSKDAMGSKSTSAYGSYAGGMGTLNASVGNGNGYQQASFGATGSVVAHPGGITFGQQVSDTFGIIEATGAEGAAVTSTSGVKVDSHGYAIVPYLSPYRRNTVDIDPMDMSTDVELKSTSKELIPSAGAVVMKKFETVTGRAAIIDLQMPPGLVVPFGTQVTTGEGNAAGVVEQGGRIMARGLDQKGTLIIKWGESTAQQCQIGYVLEPVKPGTKQTRFEHFSAPCNPADHNVRIVSQ